MTAPLHDRPYRLALASLGGVSVRVLQPALEVMGDAQSLWHATPATLTRVLGPRLGKLVADRRSEVDPQQLLAQAEQAGCWVVLFGDAAYPARLACMTSPPSVLYGRGRIELLDSPSVSLVGTRQPTPYGQRVARDFAASLAHDGFAIVSGMARGIDCVAHASALEVGGTTVAVLGCGLEVCYPPEARDLKARIEGKGLVISPFPLTQKPMPALFPARNRVIAALGHACVLVEAGIPSGALITAEVAAELERPLFVVPGNIYRPETAGGHHLLVEGTALVAVSPDDVVAGLAKVYGAAWAQAHLATRAVQGAGAHGELPAPGEGRGGKPVSLRPQGPGTYPGPGPEDMSSAPEEGALSDSERRLLALLREGDPGGRNEDVVTVEELIARSEGESAQVTAALVGLELQGWVQREPGGAYRLRFGSRGRRTHTQVPAC